MNQTYPEIHFEQKDRLRTYYDIVSLEDVINLKPVDHNQFEFHKVSFYVLLLFTKGKTRYNLNFKEYAVGRGSLFTINKNNIHKFYESQAKGVLLVFSQDFILNYSNKIEAAKIILLFNDLLSSPRIDLLGENLDFVTSLIEIAKNEHQNFDSKYSHDTIGSLIQSILSKLYQIKATNNPLFESSKYLSNFLTFQQLIERHCFKTRKVLFYADKMRLSTKSLSNCTQAIANISAKEFIQTIFLIHLKRLLASSTDSLTAISYQVGFDEPTNFFKFFRKHVGQSAKEFRIESRSAE